MLKRIIILIIIILVSVLSAKSFELFYPYYDMRLWNKINNQWANFYMKMYTNNLHLMTGNVDKIQQFH